MLKTALCLASLWISALVGDSSSYAKGPAPEWVKECEVQLEPIPLKPSQVNVQQLLIDSQRNIEEKTFYWHFATKPLNHNGIKAVAQFNIDFDPYIHQLIVHKIRVYRDGQWHDRLDSTRLELLKREENLENSLLGGDLTLAHFLEDVREGDIVDYACSFVGADPIFSKFSSYIQLQVQAATEKISHRILSNPSHPISYRAFNTSVEPRIKYLSPDLCEWTWEVFSTRPTSYEWGQPSWHNPVARVQISLYKSWQEVAQLVAPLYNLSGNLKERATPAMKDLTARWKEAAKQPAERALLALRFVQDEIRYMGFEEGDGAYKPSDPNLTLQRRFGDCKDKSFLLHALLHLMDIPSQPVLVQTADNINLHQLLPSPWAFNHIILQIDIGGRLYHCDPTFSRQGGSLGETYLPDYKWGLVISKNTTQLTPIPASKSPKPSKINTSYLFTSPDSVDLTIVRHHYGSSADHYRTYLADNGYERVSEAFVKDLKGAYSKAVVTTPLEVEDDRLANRFSFIEKYTLPTEDISGQKSMNILNLTLDTYFDRGLNLDRTAPYALFYPYWIQEEVVVENPFTTYSNSLEKVEKHHVSFWFRQETESAGTKFKIRNEFKHMKDHIPAEAVQSYWDALKELEKKVAFQTRFDTPQQQSSYVYLFYSIPFLLFIAIRVYFYRQNKKNEFIA